MKLGARFPLLKRRWLPTLIAILTSATLLGGASVTAQGQPTERAVLSISPLNFELTINPGEIRQDVVKVTNASDKIAQTITMSVDAFKGDETGQVTVIEDAESDPAYSLKKWVTVSPTTFTLQPKETRLVTFTTNVPLGSEPGGKYGAVIASTKTGEIGQTGAATVQKVGALVLLTVQGFIDYKASTTDFYTVNYAEEVASRKPLSIFEKSPVYFLARLHNSGTVHIKPKGFITISNYLGKKVADVEFPVKNVLPDSDRVQVVEWNDAKIGRYTATLVLNYGDKNEQITATTSFIVFPWKAGLPIILGIIVLLWFLVKRRNRVAKALSIIFGKH